MQQECFIFNLEKLTHTNVFHICCKMPTSLLQKWWIYRISTALFLSLSTTQSVLHSNPQSPTDTHAYIGADLFFRWFQHLAVEHFETCTGEAGRSKRWPSDWWTTCYSSRADRLQLPKTNVKFCIILHTEGQTSKISNDKQNISWSWWWTYNVLFIMILFQLWKCLPYTFLCKCLEVNKFLLFLNL